MINVNNLSDDDFEEMKKCNSYDEYKEYIKNKCIAYINITKTKTCNNNCENDLLYCDNHKYLIGTTKKELDEKYNVCQIKSCLVNFYDKDNHNINICFECKEKKRK